MSNNLVIKNDSFIQSIHNTIDCISLVDAKRSNDRCWFTSKQIQDWAGMDRVTLNRKLEKLITVGRIINNSETIENTDESMRFKFEPHQMFTDIRSITLYGANNIPHETKIYNLNVLNHLAMIELDNEKLNAIANKFSDILSEVETTGQYNAKDMPKSLPEALRAYADAIEAKELADKECERQRLIAEEAIRTKAQIGTKREATAMNTASRLSKENTKLKDELADTTEKLDQAKVELELAKSSMFTNKRVCEMLRDNFDISYADSTLKSKASKALQSIANEFGENIIYDKQFVEGVLRKVPYYTQHTVDILTQRLEYDCAYLRQF